MFDDDFSQLNLEGVSAVLKYFGGLQFLRVPHDHHLTGPSKCVSALNVTAK